MYDDIRHPVAAIDEIDDGRLALDAVTRDHDRDEGSTPYVLCTRRHCIWGMAFTGGTGKPRAAQFVRSSPRVECFVQCIRRWSQYVGEESGWFVPMAWEHLFSQIGVRANRTITKENSDVCEQDHHPGIWAVWWRINSSKFVKPQDIILQFRKKERKKLFQSIQLINTMWIHTKGCCCVALMQQKKESTKSRNDRNVETKRGRKEPMSLGGKVGLQP